MKSPKVINIRQARSTISQLVRRAAAGATVLIGPNGRAMAKPTCLGVSASPRRRLGFLKGRLVIPDDFDVPLPDDLIEDFEGRG